MVIIWGSVETTADNLEAALELSLEHVGRSRTEPGCITHGAHIDAERPNRIVFYEEWQDVQAMETHFAQPASAAFVKALAALAATPPEMRIFEATRVR
jgi:quinol monooxygenase YgiN